MSLKIYLVWYYRTFILYLYSIVVIADTLLKTFGQQSNKICIYQDRIINQKLLKIDLPSPSPSPVSLDSSTVPLPTTGLGVSVWFTCCERKIENIDVMLPRDNIDGHTR